jgi:hypothetical protein
MLLTIENLYNKKNALVKKILKKNSYFKSILYCLFMMFETLFEKKKDSQFRWRQL